MVSLYFLFFFFCFHLFLPCCFFFAFPPIYRSDGHGLITPIGSADDRGGLVQKPILVTGNDAGLRHARCLHSLHWPRYTTVTQQQPS